MSEKLSIKVNIGDRFYPLKIDSTEEERIRKASKLINEKIVLYKQRYGDKDNQDFLAMVALQYATKALESDDMFDDNGIVDQIKQLNTELDEYLQKI